MCAQLGDIATGDAGFSPSDLYAVALANLDADGEAEPYTHRNGVAHTDRDTSADAGAGVHRWSLGMLG
ncbi:MAG: hypothetical protein N2508_15620 [Anaerolineae bacterium]|nr:hypothetical protein [Anaerolineae bacterium]